LWCNKRSFGRREEEIGPGGEAGVKVTTPNPDRISFGSLTLLVGPRSQGGGGGPNFVVVLLLETWAKVGLS